MVLTLTKQQAEPTVPGARSIDQAMSIYLDLPQVPKSLSSTDPLQERGDIQPTTIRGKKIYSMTP